MSTLIIIGAGGHGKVVADCAEQIGKYKKIVFLDDSYPERTKQHIWDIIGKTKSFSQYIDSADFIVAIGENKLRLEILSTLINAKAQITSLIHPSAYVSPHSIMGLGVVVFAKAVVNIGSEIKNGCIINTGATVDHDCIIEKMVHISPGANIAGGVTIGALSWVGIGSSIIECINLASNTQIASGSTVIKSTKKNALYSGVPAIFKKSIPSPLT